MIGKTLAQYEITGLLGKGGMGEVYRAHDTKLGREVALKILPREVSGDPERASRFEREARTLASLQHPNIASIYGYEEVEGVRFLAMELVEGEDLAQRLERGSIPLDETLAIALQIATGPSTGTHPSHHITCGVANSIITNSATSRPAAKMVPPLARRSARASS